MIKVLSCSFSFGGRLLKSRPCVLDVLSLRGLNSYLPRSLFGATRFLLKFPKCSAASVFRRWASRFSRRNGWSIPSSIFPQGVSFGLETMLEAVLLSITRLSNGKWFRLVESDSTQLSPRGCRQSLNTTLDRYLFSLYLGAPISLSAVHFGGGFRQSDLVGLVWRPEHVFIACFFSLGGLTIFRWF